MIVEDDSTMRLLLQTLLELEGYNSIVYDEADERSIIEAVQCELPDVVLLDINLRHANGIDILCQLRQADFLKNIRILMSSGMDFKDDCIKAGADDFILKPYMPDELLKLLQEYCLNKK